jgi:phosphonate transport system substrate-binding protein
MTPRARWAAVLAGLSLALLPAVLPPLNPQAAPLLSRAEAQQTVLRISAIPDQNPEKLNRLYGLVADELSQQLGVPVKYVPMTDYTAAVSAFRTGNLDLVWFGGLTGVQARLQKPGATVIAQRDIDAAFHSVFIANTASGLKPLSNQKGLTALKGKRFTFGSESSTSGRLMPQYFLNQAGVSLKSFAGGAPGFSGSHDATIALVQSGAYQAGVVNEQVWKSSLREGKVNRSKVTEPWRLGVGLASCGKRPKLCLAFPQLHEGPSMQFSGTLEELRSLVERLGHPGHWEHKGAYELFVFDEQQTNLRLNWWPESGALTLVGDPAERVQWEADLQGLLDQHQAE